MPEAIVTTPSGKIEGETLGDVLVFRGIPYARPPAGELRFRAPERLKPWQGVRPARRFSPSAPQNDPLIPLARQLIGAPSGMAEDCLSLNVWTPAADGRRRPVMVWIHGGAFVLGSGATSLYSGHKLASYGEVVVVTINYRLGVLGFLNTTEQFGEEIPANIGVRDQIAALEWVRDHIEAFGGDPMRVTIFGESAGAMSVGTLLGTPRAKGLFAEWSRVQRVRGAARGACRERAARGAGPTWHESGCLARGTAGSAAASPAAGGGAARHSSWHAALAAERGRRPHPGAALDRPAEGPVSASAYPRRHQPGRVAALLAR
jgi:carboxylesterase type B